MLHIQQHYTCSPAHAFLLRVQQWLDGMLSCFMCCTRLRIWLHYIYHILLWDVCSNSSGAKACLNIGCAQSCAYLSIQW